MENQLVRVGHWEGVSYLLLLTVAMPLKYIFNLPMAVSVLGSLHGILFVWFCLIILLMVIKKELGFTQGALAVLLSLLPFGTFYLGRFVLRK
jgi:integral membrane protein